MRYYIILDELEKGPYDEEELANSMQSGLVSQTTQVRAENAPAAERRLLGAILNAAGGSTDQGGGANTTIVEEGSFGVGFAAGLLGGCVGLLVGYFVWRPRESVTWRGVYTGFLSGLAIAFLLRLTLLGGACGH